MLGIEELILCGGELGEGKKDRDTWKELAVSSDTLMV